MREIEFRGKSVKSGKWYYGDLSHGTITSGRRKNRKIYSIVDFCEVVTLPDDSLMNGSRDEAEVDSKTIGQYVGREDKNGKRIYEGDIIVVDYDCGELSSRNIMEFSESSLAYLAKQVGSTARIGPGYWGNKILVIGNIYDNPKLLEADK